jgi:uncharacterized protein YggL (DUF469 family)
MGDKQKTIEELEKKFIELKKRLKLKTTLEELDELFFIKDFVFARGFVSENLARQISARIVETYASWNTYLHNLMMPNAQSMINAAEAKMFSDAERKQMWEMIKGSMELISLNTLKSLQKDQKLELSFIDQSVDYWKKTYRPNLQRIIEKISSGWSQ